MDFFDPDYWDWGHPAAVLAVVGSILTFVSSVVGAIRVFRKRTSKIELGQSIQATGAIADPTAQDEIVPGDCLDDQNSHGDLPPVWNVPHLRNPNFTGREDLLLTVRETLVAGGRAAVTQAITGLGGIGKTQIAVEYAYRHAAEYEVIWWIKAEEQATRVSDLAGLAPSLGMDVEGVSDQLAVMNAVRAELAHRDRWLLVFDNAPDRESVRALIPQAGGGHVVVTSRNPLWAGVAKPIEVQVWPRPESIAFLLRRTGQTDTVVADVLAKELGDLPLALEQAAAYVDEQGISIGGYLERFREHSGALLVKGDRSTGYERTVASTWGLAFEAIVESCPVAADLMNVLAFLAPDDIPRDLFQKGADNLPERLRKAVGEGLSFDDAIRALRRYSLIEAHGDVISAHRLVQAVARDRLSAEDKKTWIGAAIRLIHALFPFESMEFTTWKDCECLLPHALESGGYGEELAVELPYVDVLLNQAAGYVKGRARYSEAQELLERALRLADRTFGLNHPNTAACLSNLASVLQDLGDAKGAKPLLERALAIIEKEQGPDHLNVARCLSNLALVPFALGDAKGAKPLLERALRITEQALGPDHPNVASCLGNLASALSALGDAKGAKPLLERALRINEQALGPDHPNVAIPLSNLAMVLCALGDAKGAKPLLERALRITEQALGPDHPNTATHLSNLASALSALGDAKEARALLERALGIAEKAFGPDHPNTATYLSNLASALFALGDVKGARPLLERALGIAEKAFGPDHPDVARDCSTLAAVLFALGDVKGARPLLERAVSILLAALGSDHPHTRIARSNLDSLPA